MFMPHISCAVSRGRRRRTPLVGLVIAGVFACDEGAPTDTAPESRGVVPRAAALGGVAAEQAADTSVTKLGTIPLPINQSFGSTGAAFRINQTGTGPTSNFFINNPNNSAAAIFGQSNGPGFAVRGFMTGGGRAAQFRTTTPFNSAPTLEVISVGMGGPAASFAIDQVNSQSSVVTVTTNSTQNIPALRVVNAGEGSAAYFESRADHTGLNALEVKQFGSGAAARFTIEYGNPFSGSRAALEAASSVGPAARFESSAGSGTGALEATTTCDQCPAARFTRNSPIAFIPALVVTTNGDGTDNWAGSFANTGTGGGVQITTNGGPGLQVVGGTKNAVVRMPGGARALYTEESTEVWFTDYGFSRLANGHVRVRLDPTFSETVSLGEPYHVFLQPYGRAEIYVTNRTRSGFDVSLKDGEPNVEFSYRVVAKRKGFESKRLERAPWADQSAAARRAVKRRATIQ